MKKTLLWSAILTLAVLLAACAPNPAPPTPTSGAPIAPTPASNVSPSTDQDAAWAKVVEAAKKEGVVTIYSSAMIGDVNKALSDAFRNAYGIRVEILGISGKTGVEKVRTEAQIKKAIADVLQSSGGSVTEAIQSGLTSSLASELPAVREKSAFRFDPAYSPGGEAINFAIIVIGPVVNTNLVKPADEPTSWNDLVSPKWKGKMLTVDPGATGGTAFFAPKFYNILDWDFYRKLAKQDLVLWGGNTREGVNMVARGEYPINLISPSDTLGPAIEAGAPVKMVVHKEGNTVQPQLIAATKSAPHPNAARLFINWLLTQEGQTAYNQALRSPPLRNDVPDFSAPNARIKLEKGLVLTWDMNLWYNEQMKNGTLTQIFGSK